MFPELFEPFLSHLPLSRALEKGLISVNLISLRDFATDKRGTVDSRPYGGGVGMILRIEPIWDALDTIYETSIGEVHKDVTNNIIALSPSGKTFDQQKAVELSQQKTITFICGRYEGMDARIKNHLATEVISVGNFVLSGGEIPALTIMEAVTRLLPGAIEKTEATRTESFMKKEGRNGTVVEYPQYTRPEEYRRLKVPKVLLSGNHGEIEKWRNGQKTS